MALAATNGKLSTQPYVSGYTPSKDDAALFKEMFGDNQAVIQWAARMASYYASERAEIANPTAAKPKAATPQAAPKAAPKPAAADSDSDDLFGEETEEEIAAREAKKKADAEARAAKNANKKVVIAKSSILADIKVWESETDLEALAAKIKAQEVDGLLWGAHKLTPVAFGVKKLTIMFTIEDEKVSSEDIEDLLANNFEEEVQSMDIVAWNKI